MGGFPRIMLWMGNGIPADFRKTIGLPGRDEFGDETIAPEVQGGSVVFVAHVPSAVLANPVYQQANWQGENTGWMREGENGLFGTNAMIVRPHPEGDGILIAGLAM